MPSSLPLVECEKCGERYPSGPDTDTVAEALAVAYRDHLRGKLEAALKKLTASGTRLGEIEEELGLSAGYLSKVRKRVEPSFQLVALLTLVADEPIRSMAKVRGLRRP